MCVDTESTKQMTSKASKKDSSK